jgi:hypothetical protein
MFARSMAGLLVALAGCGLASDYSGTGFRCEREGRCPDGFRCEEGICVTGDGGPDRDAVSDLDGGPQPVCGTTDALREDFDSLGPHWNVDFIGSGRIEDGELVFRPSNQTGVALLAAYDSFLLRNSRYAVRVEPPQANAAPYTQTILVVDVRDGRKLQTRLVRRHTLFFEVVSGDPEVTTFQVEVPYLPAEHAYWQIRHAGDAVVWETSRDGVDWVHQAEVAFEQEGRPAGVAFWVRTYRKGTGAANSRVAFDDLNQGEPAGVPICPASSFTDSFDGAALNTSEWDDGFFFEDSDCAAIVDRRLAVSGDCRVSSWRSFDMEDGSVSLEIPSPGQGDPDLTFTVADTGTTATRWRLTTQGYETRQLVAERTVSGEDNEVLDAMPFDPGAHRWWRIRHSSGSASLFMGVSPDGSSWDELEVAAPPDVSRSTFVIGTDDAADPLGTVAVDNFNEVP